MLNDITIGQYFPLNSIINRCDPRLKLLAGILFIVSIFLSGFISLGILLVFLIICIAISRLPAKLFLRGLKTMLPLVIFASLLNIFYGDGTVLWEYWILKITEEGLLRAATMTIRIALLLSVSSLLTYTTSPTELTDGLEQMFSPLKVIGLGQAVHITAMMMTLALRFIPTLLEETNKITSAQKARGADMESGGIIKRVKAMLPILIPLLVSAFRRAGDLAEAMECRCYNGGKGRTRMNHLRFGLRDLFAAFLVIVVCGGAIAINFVF